jgi:ankyrin repeat protein
MNVLERNNALLEAAKTGNLSEVRRLVESGADVNCRGRNGVTPVIQNASMHLAVKEYLVAHGADLNYTGFSEGTVLMLAAGAGAVDVVRRLIELGAEVNLAMPNRGETALHQAAQAGQTEVVRILLDAGANPNAFTVTGGHTEMDCGPLRGETALHFAAAYGDEEMVQALIAAGADKTIPDGYGDRPSVYLRRHHRKSPHFAGMYRQLR